MIRPAGLAAGLAFFAVLSCSPFTTRPRITPFPEADTVEVRALVPEATRRLLQSFATDSIPVLRSSARDGYVETAWLDTANLKPVSVRPLGQGVVRIRGWVDPGRVGYSVITVEGAYRVLADPSRPERELELPVPENHPVRRRIDSLLARIPTAR